MKNPNAPIVIVIILGMLAVVFGLNWPVPALLWFWVVVGLATALIGLRQPAGDQAALRRRFIWIMLAYVVLVMAAVFIVRRGLLPGWELPLALLPLIPGVLVVFNVVSSLRFMDELEQRIQMEAFGFAFGITFLALLTESLLGIADLEAGDPGVYLLYMAAAWLLGQLIARRRYQ